MIDFQKELNKSVGPDAMESMVARDLKYKRDARNRQIAVLVGIVVLIVVVIFNILILKQTADSNDQILKKLIDAFPQPK